MGLRNRGPLLKKLVPLPLTPGPQPTMAEQFRTVFNNAIIAEEEKKGQSSTYLSDSKHQYIILIGRWSEKRGERLPADKALCEAIVSYSGDPSREIVQPKIRAAISSPQPAL